MGRKVAGGGGRAWNQRIFLLPKKKKVPVIGQGGDNNPSFVMLHGSVLLYTLSQLKENRKRASHGIKGTEGWRKIED